MSSTSVVVLDNGGAVIKAGRSDDREPKLVPNCIVKAKNERKRIFVGSQLDECKDLSGLYYQLPFQRGYLVNWDVQRQVWDFTLGKNLLNIKFDETSLVVTEPFNNFTSIKETLDEILFEDYQFHSVYRTTAGALSVWHNSQSQLEGELGCLLVDSGYSFTHIVPFYKGKCLRDAMVRIDVGGKVLTNYLKEIVSYRQLHVLDETYVMNQCKEDVCLVSQDFMGDMEKCRLKCSSICCEYVLPDFGALRRGFIRPADGSSTSDDAEQMIKLGNERISVPEVLFHPSDIGINQMGVAEAICHVIESTPESIRPHLYNNILLTGGNCLFKGLRDRLYREVRSSASDYFNVNVTLPADPITYAWEGGAQLGQSEFLPQLAVTRRQYEEFGPTICAEKFS